VKHGTLIAEQERSRVASHSLPNLLYLSLQYVTGFRRKLDGVAGIFDGACGHFLHYILNGGEMVEQDSGVSRRVTDRAESSTVPSDPRSATSLAVAR
jgi:hypothetical protein